MPDRSHKDDPVSPLRVQSMCPLSVTSAEPRRNLRQAFPPFTGRNLGLLRRSVDSFQRLKAGRDTMGDMKCDYHAQGICQSCTWIDMPYAEQLAQRQATVADLLKNVENAQGMRWLPAAQSPEADYRTKVKLAIGGEVGAPTLGLLDETWQGVELENCPIVHPHIRQALPALRRFIADNRLIPYSVAERRGELKYLIVTADVRGDLMVRFVLRSRHHEALLRSRLRELQLRLPQVQVVTINLHPKHAALVEGDEELVLTDEATLPMLVGDVELHVGPRSFTQTNTVVASQLYRQVAQWMAEGESPVRTVWDLYCGVGGFALHAGIGGAQHVTGVEISDAAIDSARVAARQIFGEAAEVRTRFITADARAWACVQEERPEVLIVNPPRRGIGAQLAQWVNESGIGTVVYSSCNPRTLAQDLVLMGNYRVIEGRVFDMFPHTNHAEVAVLCQRLA